MNRWEKWFDRNETLYTLVHRKRFKVIDFSDAGLRVRLLERAGLPEITLRYDKLDALRDECIKQGLPSSNWIDEANRIWEKCGLGSVDSNESQYWAVVREFLLRSAPPENGKSTTFTEGRRYVTVLSRSERNSKLRKECIKEYGAKCCVCDMEFVKRYGPIGEDFIHIHHLKPLSEIADEYKAKVSDMRPVCPNCHAMLHKRRPKPYSPAELKAKLIDE